MGFDPRNLPGTYWQHRGTVTLHPPRNPTLVDKDAPHDPLPQGTIVWGQAGGNTPFHGTIAAPGVLSDVHQGSASVDVIHWGEGNAINLIALSPGTPGADHAPPALAQAQTTWHTRARVQVQRADYALQRVVNSAGHPVGAGWLVLRGMPAAGQPVSSNIFLLRTDAHGNVVAARTHWLCRGDASHPYAGGAHYSSSGFGGVDFNWLDFHAGGDRTVRVALGVTYKSIWLSGDSNPLLANAPQLLGLLDPSVDPGHVVTPAAEDAHNHRIPSTPVSVAGALMRFPDDAPAADAPAQIRRAFDLLRQFNEARVQLVHQPEEQARIAGAHLVSDYFDASGWTIGNEYITGDNLTSAIGLLQHEQFQNAEQAQHTVQEAAQRAGHAIALMSDRARDLRQLFAPAAGGGSGTPAIQAFTDWVIADPRGRAGWVMSFFSNLADHLADDTDPASATLRRNIVNGLCARGTNDFTLLRHALETSGAHPAASTETHHDEHRIAPPSEGEGEEAEGPEASELIDYGAERLVGALEIWGSLLEQRLTIGEQALEAGTETAQHWREQLLEHLHHTVEEPIYDLIEQGPEFLADMRQAGQHLHGADALDFMRAYSRLEDHVGSDGFLRRLQLNHEHLESIHASGEAAAQALERVGMVLAGVGLLEQCLSLRVHMTHTAMLAHAHDMTDHLGTLVSSLDTVWQGYVESIHPNWAEGPASQVALGNLAKWTGGTLAVISFGLQVWQVFWPPFHANHSAREEDAEMLELVASATAVMAMVTPPPIDAAFTALNIALEGVNLIFGSIFDFYYSPQVQQMEAMKRKLALFTDYAREPDFFFPVVEVEGHQVKMRGAAPPSQALYNRAHARWKLVMVLAHVRGEGEQRKVVPLARRSAIAHELSDGINLARTSDCSTYLSETTLPWINWEPTYDAAGRMVVSHFTEDLTWLPQFGWGASNNHPSTVQLARVDELLHIAYPDDRPASLPVRAHVLAVEASTSAEETAEKVWNYFYGDSDKAELVGISEEQYPITFSSGTVQIGEGQPVQATPAERGRAIGAAVGHGAS